MLIDTHCHLTDQRFTDIGEVLKRAFEAGVERVIMPSTGVEDAKKAVQIAEKYKQYCLVGIHPEEVGSFGFAQDDEGTRGQQAFGRGMDPRFREDDKSLVVEVISELEEILKGSKRVVGVGEIGMDFYYDRERKTKHGQVKLFQGQMELALESDLPVAIHMREAEAEMGEELIQMKNVPRGEFHCFAGSLEFLETILKMGFYVGFGGNITYKSAGNLRELLKKVPLDRLLLETDSPYLPPEPLRGTVNTPANVKITAEFIAQELNLDLAELAKTTSQNAKCLYSLDIS